MPLTKPVTVQGSGATTDLLVHTCSYESGFFIWFGFEVAFLAVFILWGLVLAISARNLPSEFNESTHILMCLFALALAAIILPPIDFLVQDSPKATTLLRVRLLFEWFVHWPLGLLQGLGQCFVALVLAAMLFVPKLYFIVMRAGRNDDSTNTDLSSPQGKQPGVGLAPMKKAVRVEAVPADTPAPRS